ncbi:DUF2865 domain-containing protein [Bradyrhizobium viridifuturi]|nr:DUF2865 domain-containing protein [Bradyrhizobium viridifuturi]MCA3565722.1 DUF2865 domain-containing protein [Bradyrhizobium sp.]OYU64012.1 MAG: hypothetical protein CFE30_02365 [Bradyrhizobium sp. PARBB1]PSO20104.1 hypothetical protein C7G43_28470 [Bradyrhizobium sp. MOS004]QRI73633.1 DUF2865 domain-containing protein [Bradyrhizobium sp. PSBB068]
MPISWTPDSALNRRVARAACVAALIVIAGVGICSPASAQLLPSDSAYAPAHGFFSMPGFEQAPGFEPAQQPRTRVYITTRSHWGGRQNFCVRTCDGRFFPLPRLSETADVRSCEAACPAAEVKLYSGSDIDSARTGEGEAYRTLANAFRFQREIVPQCSCRSSASTGLSPIAIEDDMTLRSGDIIAADDGFKIAAITSGARRSVLFRPLSKAKAQALGLARLSSR